MTQGMKNTMAPITQYVKETAPAPAVPTGLLIKNIIIMNIIVRSEVFMICGSAFDAYSSEGSACFCQTCFIKLLLHSLHNYLALFLKIRTLTINRGIFCVHGMNCRYYTIKKWHAGQLLRLKQAVIIKITITKINLARLFNPYDSTSLLVVPTNLNGTRTYYRNYAMMVFFLFKDRYDLYSWNLPIYTMSHPRIKIQDDS